MEGQQEVSHDMLNVKKWLIYLTILGAALILIDSLLPGALVESTIIGVSVEEEYYNNAAQNSHNSYHVITEFNQFDIKKERAGAFEKGQTITMRLSPLFKEVQSFSIEKERFSNLHTLRIFTGIIAPILILLMMGIALRFGSRVNTLTFVFQAILIAHLIYLFQ